MLHVVVAAVVILSSKGDQDAERYCCRWVELGEIAKRCRKEKGK
jgi:hypothetical protein